MAIRTKTLHGHNLNGELVHETFQWATEDFDTLVVTSHVVSGSPDGSADPQWTIESSMDLIDWFGTTTLDNGAVSAEINITAPHMRVRLTVANATSPLLMAVSVQLRKDL